jgi:7-keto-8-aminopelargonate synthetase-like enzyme
VLWLIRRFRRRLAEEGVRLAAGLFPVQRLPTTDPRQALAVQAWLLRAGLRTLVTRPACRTGAAVTVILTPAVAGADVDRTAALLAAATRGVATAPRGAPP